MMTPSRIFGLALTGIAILGLPSTLRAEFPKDWGGGGEGYELSRDETVKHGGKASGSVKAKDDAKNFGSLTSAFAAEKFKGKRLRMSAWVKTDNIEGFVGLWMRVDGREKIALAFDNMQERPIKGTNDWKKYEVVLDIPDQAEEIYFGFLVDGKGQGWVDDFSFEAVGNDVPKTSKDDLQPADRVGELNSNLRKEPANLDFEK